MGSISYALDKFLLVQTKFDGFALTIKHLFLKIDILQFSILGSLNLLMVMVTL